MESEPIVTGDAANLEEKNKEPTVPTIEVPFADAGKGDLGCPDPLSNGDDAHGAGQGLDAEVDDESEMEVLGQSGDDEDAETDNFGDDEHSRRASPQPPFQRSLSSPTATGGQSSSLRVKRKGSRCD